MPSPIGHALGALASGWLGQAPLEGRRPLLMQVACLAALGMAPDLDLLIGRHRAETHSLGAAVLVASVAAWRRWPIGPTRIRVWLAAFLAWASHPLLDACASDTLPPLGVMAFWPLTREYVLAPWPIFLGVSRAWESATFVPQNTMALTRELLILIPLVVMVGWWRRARR